MQKTLIEWAKNPDGTQGYTLNDKTGCLNGCPYCYARRLANGRLKPLYLANTQFAIDPLSKEWMLAIKDPFYPRWWSERLKEPYRIKKPAGFFLDDMSDWMGSYWPAEWTEAELQMMRDNPQHRIYTLTKQPQNLIKWSPFPNNCYVGATCTSKRIVNHTLPFLMKVGAGLVYLSLEPLLDWDDHSAEITGDRLLDAGVGWVIIGSQTKPTVYPKLEWVEEIVRACDKAGIPVFLKNSLFPLLEPAIRNSHHQDVLELGGEVPLRQEMPK